MFKFILQRLTRLLLVVLIAVIIHKLLTFGWKYSFKENTVLNMNRESLVNNLEKHVYKLSHKIGERSVFKYDKLQLAAEYISEQFKHFGYKVEFQGYEVYGKEVKNIIAVKKSKSNSNENIILGAHYDTCFNPGADDNASGVAGLLELARYFADIDTPINIQFVAFVNEEPPFFKTEDMGSRVFVHRLKESQNNIKAAIILEMIGVYSDKPFSQNYPLFFGLFYPNKANFIGIVSNFKSAWLAKSVRSSFKKNSKFPVENVVTVEFIPGVDFSDHWSFWMENYPAIMITDTGFYRYPNYHKHSDTYEKLSYKNMAEVVDGLKEALVELSMN